MTEKHQQNAASAEQERDEAVRRRLELDALTKRVVLGAGGALIGFACRILAEPIARQLATRS